MNPLDLLFSFSLFKLEFISEFGKAGAVAFAFLLAWSLEYFYTIKFFFMGFPEKEGSILSRP